MCVCVWGGVMMSLCRHYFTFMTSLSNLYDFTINLYDVTINLYDVTINLYDVPIN